jgi:Helix-turn-helix.
LFEIDLEMAAKIREKRARKNSTLQSAAEEIGISSKTLGEIENEKKTIVRKTVFKKIINWLINEKSKNYTGVD